jgi:hypothetical protein
MGQAGQRRDFDAGTHLEAGGEFYALD